MRSTTKTRFGASKVQNWIGSEIKAGRLENGVLEIMHSGETVYSDAFGLRHRGGSQVTRDTQYWIASMTKPIISVAVMRLIERGDLSLADPVSEYIPGFGTHGVLTSLGDLESAQRAPNILDLLTHTSGVTYGFSGSTPIHTKYRDAKVYDFQSDNAQMAERLSVLPLLYQPGTTFEYGMSTDLLGYVVERLTNQRLNHAIKDLVLKPLKMKDTTFTPDSDRLAEIPISEIRRSLAPPFSLNQTWWSGGAGLCSTVPDYVKFAHFLLNGGSVLNPDTLSFAKQNHLPQNIGYGSYTRALGITAPRQHNGLGFGLGFAIRTVRTPHLSGGIGEILWPGASGANFWVDPENSLIVVFLTHSPDHRLMHRIGLREAIYAGLD